jgi:hypothetical protein
MGEAWPDDSPRVIVEADFDPRRLAMAGVERREFDSPDESRTPDKTRVDVVRLGVTTAARFTNAYVNEPGHDAEILGDERFVGFDFEHRAAEEYARQ